MSRLQRLAAGALLALSALGAQAAVGLAELPARGEDGPVTVFYPSSAPAAGVDRGFPTCVGLALQLQGDVLDGPRKALARAVIPHRLADEAWYAHTDPRVAAVVAEVPFAVDFDPASLAKPRAPLGLVRAGRDAWLAPRHHIDRVLRACSGCELLADLPTAGHGSLLSPPPPGLSSAAEALLRDPPGFDRALVPPVHTRVAAFFQQHLLP